MENNNNYVQEDTIELKSVFLNIKEYIKEIWSKKFIVLLIGFIFAAFMAFKSITEIPKYSANLTFMLDDDDGGGMSGLSSLLGSFGFGGSGGGGQNLDKMLQLSKTRKISKIAFFKKINFNGKDDFLANHIIDHYDSINDWYEVPSYKFWEEESKLKNFRFSHDSMEIYSNLENLALKVIQQRIVGNDGTTTSRFNENTGIIAINTVFSNPELAILITNNLFEALSEYYVKKSIEKSLFTYNILKTKSDSIKQELKSSEYALAQFQDTKQNLFKNVDRLEEIRLKGRIKMAYGGLAVVAENLELADFALKSNTPLIQVIDEPVLPLFSSKKSIYTALINGFLLGLILSIAFFIIRKFFRNIMS